MVHTKSILFWMILMKIVIHMSLSIPIHEQSVISSDHKQMADRNFHFMEPTMTSQLIAPISSMLTTNTNELIMNVTRNNDGDIFWTNGVTACNMDTCKSLSTGTAFWLANNKPDKLSKKSRKLWSTVWDLSTVPSLYLSSTTLPPTQPQTLSTLLPFHSLSTVLNQNVIRESCRCKCLPYLNSYREDLGVCVDDIHECNLSPFVSGTTLERIPFVFLPLRGQIIYPSREIRFADINTPMCAVTGAQYLTSNGWSDLRNPITNDYPFRMFRDEGRTFLQWLGESDLRYKMQGRLILVRLVCRDMNNTLNMASSMTKDHTVSLNNIFSSCVAFRVNGSPVQYTNNVSEVLFQSETTSILAANGNSASTKEYIVICICTFLLGLVYITSVLLYLHVKKRKLRDQNIRQSSFNGLPNKIKYAKNDQVTFGVPFTRSESLYSSGSLTAINEPCSRTSLSSLNEEIGIIKNNPLLQQYPQLNDQTSGFTSDISNSTSENETDATSYREKSKQKQTNVLIHSQLEANLTDSVHRNNCTGNSFAKKEEKDPETNILKDVQENERLLMENVAIIEDMINEEKLESLRNIVNGSVRKKLYFNPAYFEPHLLAQPPPAAIEFLQKIREVITLAKYKMATKRYQPSLIMIPEEGVLHSSTPTLYDFQQIDTSSEHRTCSHSKCSNYLKKGGEKRNSIEKWLQAINESDVNNLVDELKEIHSQATLVTNSNECFQEELKDHHSPCLNIKSFIKNENQNNLYKSKSLCSSDAVTKPLLVTENKSNANTNSLVSCTYTKKNLQEKINLSDLFKPNLNSHYKDLNKPISNEIKKFHNFLALSEVVNGCNLASTGNEIYNNPSFFLHDATATNTDKTTESLNYLKSDLIDTNIYMVTPLFKSSTALDKKKYTIVDNTKLLTQDVGKVGGYDYTASIITNNSFHMEIPTPDYDITIEKNIKDIYNNTQSSGPSVPTPDYSSLSRKSVKQCQLDSPICKRKSPQYLIVDYETDSLERLDAIKRKNSQASSSPSSEVSSQLSPSLSTALPLEEELEISHTVLGNNSNTLLSNRIKKKTNPRQKSEVSQNDITARIKYDTPFRGSMTIEVEHELPSDLEHSTDSDQYESDTLDRKPRKHSFCDINTWSSKDSIKPLTLYQQLQDNTPIQGHQNEVFKNRSMQSMQFQAMMNSAIGLKQRIDSISNYNVSESKDLNSITNLNCLIDKENIKIDKETSLSKNIDKIYDSIVQQTNTDKTCKCGGKATNIYLQEHLLDIETGRILTLEAKHCRRQRPSEIKLHPQFLNSVSEKQIDTANDKESLEHFECNVETPMELSNSNETNLKTDTPPINNQEDEAESKTETNDCTLYKNIVKDVSIFKTTLMPSFIKNMPKTPFTNTLTAAPFSPSNSNSKASQNHLYSSTVEDETLSQCTEVTGFSEAATSSEFDETMKKNAKSNSKKTYNLEKLGLEFQIGSNFLKKINDEQSEEIYNKDNNSNFYIEDEYNKYENNILSLEEPNNDIGVNASLKLKENLDIESTKLDTTSLCSRSTRGSYCLSQTTSEMYRNSGVPVGIAYPQRNTSNTNNINSNSNFSVLENSTNSNNNNDNFVSFPNFQDNNNNNNNENNNSVNDINQDSNVPASSFSQTSNSNNIHTVYRCEIEPVYLSQGMQITMGLKDRPKRAKDIKNAWKKFVSMASSKFSATSEPQLLLDKKSVRFFEKLQKNDITEKDLSAKNLMTTTYANNSNQNYYEQRFGSFRVQEMDSGYLSADSEEVYKRRLYDQYNYKIIRNKDYVIAMDAIDKSAESSNSITDNSSNIPKLMQTAELRKDLPNLTDQSITCNNISDNESEKTLTSYNNNSNIGNDNDNDKELSEAFSCASEDPTLTSYDSSDSENEAIQDNVWESGAESIETHSVLYKNVRRSIGL